MSRRPTAVRVAVPGGGACEPIAARARELGVLGWVRCDADRVVRLHAEGAPDAVEALTASLPGAEAERAKVEGHEQFAIRGVRAGVFVVQQHAASTRHFDLRLEVGGAMRSWAVPKGPSMDPSVQRLAVQVADHGMAHNDVEGPLGDGAVIIWDRGGYEQGGRVAWPDALERGHAVFVLHGSKLHGGFALQRTREGAKAQWLLVKRRDDEALPGTDVVADRPESVVSGRALDELLG